MASRVGAEATASDSRWEAEQHGALGMERILAFSDGVFAIVITLLALEIKVPELEAAHIATDLVPAVWALAPTIISHALSFALLGINWIAHHALFRMIERWDRNLLWLNILFLLFVASMPFPTGLVIRYSNAQISYLIFCAVLILAGLSLVLMWWYAAKDRRLLSEAVANETIRDTYRRGLLAPVLYLVAALLSFVSLNVTKVTLALIVLIYIIPNPLTRVSRHSHHGTHVYPAVQGNTDKE